MLLLTVLGLALTVSTVNGACVASYKKYALKHVSGGTSQAATVNTVAICQTVCDSNTKCAGFDFTNANVCWLVFDPDTPITDDSNADHYRRITTCTNAEAVCEYEYIGPYSATKLDTKAGDQCSDDCNTNPACKGFFISTATGTPCDTVSDVAKGVRTEVTTNTLYKQVSCNIPRSEVCKAVTYFETKDKHVSGGQLDTSGSASVTACQGLCSSSTACIGIDYLPASTQCYFITDPKVALADQTGTNNYAVQRECTTGTTTCKYQRTGSYVPSGTKSTKTASQTFDQCATLCNNDGGCTQFAYDAKTQDCVTSTGTTQDSIANADNTMYTKTTPCPATTTTTTTPTTTSTTTVTTVSTGTTTPGCVNVFTETKDRSSTGGMQDGNAKTVDACKKVCADTAACVAFDFVVASNQCWINKDIKNLDDARTSAGINQYKIERCVKVCNPTYTSKEKTGSSEGIKSQVTINVVDDCKKVCTDDKACLGFDFGPGTQCWIHSDADKFKVKKAATDSTQYTIARCDASTDTTTTGGTTGTTTAGCVNTFTSTTGRSSSGGVRNTAANTLDLCKKACGDESKCVAFDFLTSGNECWLHNAIANLNNERSTADSTQYKIQRCVQPCKNEFKSTASRSSSGGVRDTSVTTLEACKTNCVADDKCVGFDYTASNQCWIHQTKDNLQKGKTTTGVTQYEIVRCVDGTTTPDGGTTLDTTTGTPACINKFTSTASRSSGGGVRNTAANTVDLCKKACRDESKCVAFDYLTSSSQCWLHNAIANLNDERSTADSTQYKIQRCVQPCKNEFKSTPSRSSDKAVLKSSATTLEACKALCVADEKCVGFDYTTSNQCWIHENKDNFNDQRNTADSTQYVIERCVDGATTTATPTGTGGTTGTPACIPSWDSGATGISSSGGLRRVSFGSYQQCQNGCVADKACLAIDFSSTGCYFHLNADFRNNRRSTDATSTQYILTRCGCVPSWDAGAKSTSSSGGVRKATLGSLQQCQVGCVVDKACLAIDFSSTGCYFHLNADFKNNRRSTDATSTQYILTRCAATGCPEFKEYKDVHASGGIPNAAADTLAKCQDVCDKNSDCKSIDYTAGGSIKCYILTMEKKPGTSDLSTLVGTNHYTLICRTGQTKPTAAPTPTAPACINQWAVTASTHSGGGKFNGAGRTLVSCRKLCADDANCLAIDFNDGASPKECWIHTDATSLAVKRTSDPNINQNIISRCTGCTPSFTKTDDVHGKGGKLQTGVNTLAACQANCVALASCVALDFTDANACWFFEAAGYATEADTANTHYVIKRCTDASTTPAGGTTRAPCVTYEGSTNMKASGGFIIGVFTDLDSCKNGCSSSPGCFGINFLATAAANQRCELVFSSSGVASASGYTYYAASRCDATTTQAATTSRAP